MIERVNDRIANAYLEGGCEDVLRELVMTRIQLELGEMP